jgi:diguanylate cyclase (GGDEF)-like protein/PAS domain S-box-containing protein
MTTDTADEALLRAVVERGGALVGVGDASHTRLLSPSVLSSLGWGPSGLPSPLVLAHGLVHPDDRERLSRVVEETTASGEPVATHVRLRHADGSFVTLDCLVQDLRADERVRGFMVQAWDVTAREAAFERAALYDALTGLPNRVLLRDRLAQALRAQQRHATRVGVIYLDLDDFKAVNDQHGHAVGDAVLRETGERLTRAVRPGDTAARLSGDEFAVLCEQLADLDAGYEVSRRLARALEPPIVVDGVSVTVSASMGVALALDPLVTPERLITLADTDMYVVKRRRGPLASGQ